MRLLQLAVGGFDHNFSYLLQSGTAAMLVDPTGSTDFLRSAIRDAGVTEVGYIRLTHGHADHYEALEAMKCDYPAAEICGHPGNPVASRRLQDGESLQCGDCRVDVLFTPGHSRDSVSYLVNDEALLTGDTLFVDYVGFARNPESLYSSLRRISKLPPTIVIYPGHDYGSVPYRTLAEEKNNNPYLCASSLSEFKIKLKDLT